MTKLRIAIVAVLVLALLGLPPVFGSLAESQVDAYVESARTEQIDVTIDEYERGWFSSRGQLTYTPVATDPSIAAIADLVGPITVSLDVNHGPISFKDGFFLGLSELHARPIDAEQAGPLDFTVEAQTTFGGNVHFLADVMPIEYEDAVNAVSFSGARFTGTGSQRHLDMRAESDSIQISGNDGTLSVVGIRASADNEVMSGIIAPGTMAAEIDRIAFESTAGTEPVFDASEVGFDGRTVLDDTGERLQGSTRFTLSQARIGEDGTISDALFEFSARNLDVQAIQAYYDLVTRPRPRGAPAAPTPAEIEPVLMQFFAGGASLSIDTLRFDLDALPFEASAEMHFDESALPAAGAVDLDDPALWSRLVSGRAELTAAKPLVERMVAAAVKAQLRGQQSGGQPMPNESLDALAEAQVGLALGMLSAQGLIEDTGDLYRTAVEVDDGTVTVNGQPMPVPGLP